ncbi:TetR-like C-terminal domain-containing protein [Gordonia sp. NPDC003429]
MTQDARRTEELLAAALTIALETTPLAKVTVSGLATAAGVSRQTFYAHFSDVYDLAAWMFRVEVADQIMARAHYDSWADGLLEMLRYMCSHREQVHAVLRSLRLAETEHFLFGQLRQMMSAIVDEVQGDLVLSPADRDFAIDHYTLTVLGHVLHWLARDMRDDPGRLVADLEYVLHGSVRETLTRLAARPIWD